MTEILGIYSFLRSRLSSSSDLTNIIGTRIYAGIAPSKDPATSKPPIYPLVSYSVRSSRDRTVVDGESAYLDCLVDVKLVHTLGLGAMEAADGLIFSLLHRSNGRVGSIQVMGCHREGHIITEKVDGDTIYRYSIQSYRIRASRLP